jgi:hypothetical protein
VISANTQDSERRTPRSSATVPIAVLLVLSVLYLPLRYLMESPTVSDGLYQAAYLYGTALQIVLAAVIVAVAVMIGMKQSVGRQWLLLGLGVAVYAIGDICWTLFELFLEIDPFPSIADIFYTAEYVFFLAAIVLAIRAYSGLVPTKKPLLIGVAVAAVGAAVLYFALLQPYIIPAGTEELGLWGLVVSILYPVGDVVFMLAPAIALALVVRQLGAGKLARPWWLVVVGALVFALVDSFFIYTDWAGLGYIWILDIGYLAANLFFASAALVARDVYRLR